MEKWNAVVLGGGDPNDPFAAAHGVAVKPLIEVDKRPMAVWVLSALRESGWVNRIAYVGPLGSSDSSENDLASMVDLALPDTGQMLSNLEAGVTALGQQSKVLIVTADIPLISATVLRDVFTQVAQNFPEASLIYPVVQRETCEAAFPGARRTYVRLQEGVFTGGNLFFLDPVLLQQFLPKIQELLALRKKPWAIAQKIGWDILLRLVLGRLTIAQLEERISTMLSVPAHALITPHAEIGFDVDKEEDLVAVQAALGRRYVKR